MWFAASLIISIRRLDQSSGPILVTENVVLIEAANAGDALNKAQEIGKSQVTAAGGFTIDDKPAAKAFVGIRKLSPVSNPARPDLDHAPPASGSDITQSLFEVDDDDALEALVDGKEVRVAYRE